jgi:hypothetical protein
MVERVRDFGSRPIARQASSRSCCFAAADSGDDDEKLNSSEYFAAIR